MGSPLTEQLDALVHGQLGRLDGEIKLVLSRLAHEAKTRLEKASPASYDFFAATSRSISKIRGSAHADVRMGCLFDCASYFMANRNSREALECARQLELLARKSGNQSWLRKGLMAQGLFYGLLGDCGQGLHYLSRSLDMAREQHDHAGEASVLINLGSTLNYAGLYREALPCFKRAIEIAQHEPSCPASREASALCNLAQSFLYLGEHDKGLTAISECLAKSDEPSDAMSGLARATREYTFVQLALETGRISAAREHARRCRNYSLLGGAKAEVLAELSDGLCQIHGGDVQKGIGILERALLTAEEKGSAEHVDALTALVQAYDHSFQPEKALEHMTILIKTIRNRRETSIDALLQLNSHPNEESVFAPEERDLGTLNAEQMRLRALVAEREVTNCRVEMLERFAVTADLKEEASGEHGYRVGRLCGLVAENHGWSRDACLMIDGAARLHDIGKVAIPDHILLTSKQLQQAERHFMSTHTTIGAELLGKSNIPQLRMAEEIARYHHEWWNGEGYPSKLKGKRIPIHARIVALADVFDALTHGRPFSPPWPIDKALEEIKGRKGTQFDPDLTDLFLDLIDRLRKEHKDLDEYLGRAGKSSPFLQARNRIRQMLADERENEKRATVAGNETRH